jgi:hypothetical protein
MYIVDIMGGFGNQLFQICFALYLKKEGKKPFIYIINPHDNSDHNVYMLEEENFNLSTVGSFSKSLIRNLKSIPIINDKIFSVINQDSMEEIKANNISNMKLVNSYNGFWQDKLFVDVVLDEFKTGFFKNEMFNDSIKKVPIKGSTMLHIRRGDHQAYLPLDYYKDAIKEAGRINNFNYDIYTDDPEWVKSQGIFNNAKNVYGPSKESNIQSDTLNTFARMLTYENFIISNSTFSWWAAKLSERKESKIFYPYPHWPNYQPDIFYDNWIRINR